MHSPFGGWRHHLSPASGGTITRAYCRTIYEESVSRCFILPPAKGEIRRSPDRGWRAQRANQQNCFSCHMIQRANPVTLTLCSSPLKGKRLTTFCASLALLHPLLSLTHWIFRSLMLPYKSSSHSAKCVCCASLRSGDRRLAVRTAMEHPIGALLRTPFPASRDFPSRGNEKIGGTGYCVTYDTESQSRNADFILIALRAIPQPSA